MLIRTMNGTLAWDEQVGTPTTSFGQMMLGSQRGPSFVARLLATPVPWAGPDSGAVPTRWTET